jgi:serine/threonine protein kinase
VDWYALGVLIYEMLIGQPPYYEARDNHQLLYRRIIEGPSTLRWPAISELSIDIICKLMDGDPTRRLGNMWGGAGAIFQHPWFKEVEWDKLARREITAPYLPKIQSQGDASA